MDPIGAGGVRGRDSPMASRPFVPDHMRPFVPDHSAAATTLQLFWGMLGVAIVLVAVSRSVREYHRTRSP